MKINTEKILKDFTSFAKSFENLSELRFTSFCFSLDFFDPVKIIDDLNKSYEDIFLLRTPENALTLLGINSALEFQPTNALFSSVSEQVKSLHKNFHKNWDELNFNQLKIICCAVKFDPSKSSELWNDFESLRIYIPEFIFFSRDKMLYGFFNVFQNDNKNLEGISNKLLAYLNKIEDSLENEPEDLEVQIISKSNSNEEKISSWQNSFNQVLEKLQNGEAEKIVLSRVHTFTIKNSICWTNLLKKLYGRFNDCYLFFVRKKDSIFFGSSPEMFLRVKGKNAEVESVAGSAPRGEKFETDNQFEKLLQASEKNHQEHIFVSDFISDILVQYSDNVRITEEKQIRKLDNIQHLITKISAELNYKNNLFELIDSLFPTPAVCGVPKETAMHIIRKIESHDRGLYSGLIGLMDFNSECEFAVSIRSALVKNNTVNAFAGAGLVKNSIMNEEFLETELKLNTILSLFSDER